MKTVLSDFTYLLSVDLFQITRKHSTLRGFGGGAELESCTAHSFIVQTWRETQDCILSAVTLSGTGINDPKTKNNTSHTALRD